MSKTEELTKIINFLKKYDTIMYCCEFGERKKISEIIKINEDLTVDIGNEATYNEIFLPGELTEIPFKINNVYGDFISNNEMTTLKNFPNSITGKLRLYWKENIKILDEFPREISRLDIEYKYLHFHNSNALKNKEIIEASVSKRSTIDESNIFCGNLFRFIEIDNNGNLYALPDIYDYDTGQKAYKNDPLMNTFTTATDWLVRRLV